MIDTVLSRTYLSILLASRLSKTEEKVNRQNSENLVLLFPSTRRRGSTWPQIIGIYESYTFPLPPPPLAAADRPPLSPTTNGGRHGQPRGVVGARPGGTAPALDGAPTASVAVASAAGTRLALAPAGPHVPRGGQATPPPAPRALPRRPRRQHP
jgi:hypothetical protein